MEYSRLLTRNLAEVHEKMCTVVFSDIMEYLVETNKMLDIERNLKIDGENRVQLLPVACLNTGFVG